MVLRLSCLRYAVYLSMALPITEKLVSHRKDVQSAVTPCLG